MKQRIEGALLMLLVISLTFNVIVFYNNYSAMKAVEIAMLP